MHNYNYRPSPENGIRHGTTLILYDLSHKETGQPAWDAAEERTDAIGRNGPTGEHYSEAGFKWSTSPL